MSGIETTLTAPNSANVPSPIEVSNGGVTCTTAKLESQLVIVETALELVLVLRLVISAA